MAITIELTGHDEDIVRELLATGRYRDAADVVSEALFRRLISPWDQRELKEMIEAGMKDIEAGRTQAWDREKFVAELEARWQQKHGRSAASEADRRAAS